MVWLRWGVLQKSVHIESTGTTVVSTLSKTKRLISVVSQNSETASFVVSVEQKLTTLDA
jgi:hypothetical protein